MKAQEALDVVKQIVCEWKEWRQVVPKEEVEPIIFWAEDADQALSVLEALLITSGNVENGA